MSARLHSHTCASFGPMPIHGVKVVPPRNPVNLVLCEIDVINRVEIMVADIYLWWIELLSMKLLLAR